MTMLKLPLLIALLLAACNDAPPSHAQTPAGAQHAADAGANSDADAEARFEAASEALAFTGVIEPSRYPRALREIVRYHAATGDARAPERVIAFVEQLAPHYAHWSRFGLAALVDTRAPEFVEWLQAGGSAVTSGVEGWSAVASGVRGSCGEAAGCWRDPVVMQLLKDKALDPTASIRARDAALKAFAAAGTYAEADALARLEEENTAGNLNALYGILARYDTPVFTSKVRERLRRPDDDFLLHWLVEQLLVLGRHDLLPELRELASHAELALASSGEGARPSTRYDAEQLREAVQEAVLALEAARAGGVVPGLPLDWPATADDYGVPAP